MVTHRDDFESEEERDAPGPGEYTSPYTNSAFLQRQRPEVMQYFGSTVERFPEDKSRTNPTIVGPGTYSIESLGILDQKRSKKKKNIAFATSDKRFKQEQVNEVIPGPGTYKAKGIVENLSKKQWGKQGVFGCTEKRFSQAGPQNVI